MRRVNLVYFILAVLLSRAPAFAQSSAQVLIESRTDSLNRLAKQIQRGENDSVRDSAQENYLSVVKEILNDSTSFRASFDSIPNLSVQSPPDHSFRMYTWVAANYEGTTYRYYGFLQIRNPSNGKFSLYELRDSTDAIAEPVGKKLKADRWYGFLCYDILQHTRNKKKFYTLLGWKGRNASLTQKVLDVVTFDKGMPVFGFAVFKNKNIYRNRILFEFTAQATMSLKYLPEKDLIVFDHIGKSVLTGAIGPDGTYDAFKFVKGHWEFLEDVDVDNGFVPRMKEVPLFKDEDLGKKKEDK